MPTKYVCRDRNREAITLTARGERLDVSVTLRLKGRFLIVGERVAERYGAALADLVARRVLAPVSEPEPEVEITPEQAAEIRALRRARRAAPSE